MPKGGPGKPKSEEHRKRIAQALRGKLKSASHKRALSKPKSEEHKRKLSEINHDPGVQAKRRATMLRLYGVEHPKKLAKFNNLRTEYWLAKGYSEAAAKEMIAKFQHAASKKRKTNVSHWTTVYWIKKGLTKQQAKEKVSQLQISNASKTAIIVSRESQKFLDVLEREGGIKIEREQTLLGKFMVDGFIPSKKIVIEYWGSFWHMHPTLFKPLEKHRITGWTAQAKWNEDAGRIKRLELEGYEVIPVWDVEVNQKKIQQIIRRICR